MYGLENELCDQLKKLKDRYGLCGIKAEFEAEGSSFRDIVRLRRITAALGVKLFVKIGGVEAAKDIKDSVDLGVDGLIAPMVESRFGVKKFLQAYDKIYKNTKLHLTLNIETKNAVNQIEEILDYAKGKIDAITIGRTDLSDSYFSDNVYPDSKFIVSLLESMGKEICHRGFDGAIGGSLTVKSLAIFKEHEKIQKFYNRMETRKVILSTRVMLSSPQAIKEALKFEELYILSKKEISDLFIESEVARLTQLERRI